MADAKYVLGLNLGTNSIGWAAIDMPDGGMPRLRAAGVRVFGSDAADIAAGREEPANVKRRLARLARRQIARRALRRARLFHLLQEAGLLPPGDATTPLQRDRILKELDDVLRAAHPPANRVDAHLLPYSLRARGLSEPLSRHELGRALIHLGQRRGFKSSRKAAPRVGTEPGVVASAIQSLRDEMAAGGHRTLGAFLASLDPEQRRIRGRWTDRAMHEEEFAALWDAQRPHHADILNEELRSRLHRAIFRQRPLRTRAVEHCELEPGRRRAPKALLLSQRFRLVRTVMDLRVTNGVTGEQRALGPSERALLIDELDMAAGLTLARVKKLLRIRRDHELHLGARGAPGSDPKAEPLELGGNRTAAWLIDILGREAWLAMDAVRRDALVTELRMTDNDELLRRRAQSAHGLSPAEADALTRVTLDPGHVPLSRRAMQRLLPLMEGGLTYSEAREQVYPHARIAGRDLSRLPALVDVPSLSGIRRDPTLARALTQMRQLVNAAVSQWGRPSRIRLRLDRDLKRSRKQRAELDRIRRDEAERREEAAARILRETSRADASRADASRADASRADVERVLLHDECGGTCPYTGEPIAFRDLFGEAVEVRHIIPFNRSLDDSFANKTLCLVAESRRLDASRTPLEIWGATPRWEEILGRVRRFQGRHAARKLRLFTLSSEEVAASLDALVARQHDDTQRASRLAGGHAAMLHGERLDVDGTPRVAVSSGQLNPQLRRAWNLVGILGDGDIKARSDHRHHALDAVVTALSSPAAVRALAAGPVEPPWAAFADDVRAAVRAINVSHRPSRRLSGALHAETLYRRPLTPSGDRAEHVHRRVRVDSLTIAQLEHIVDPRIRAAVTTSLESSGHRDPKDAFKLRADHPFTATKDGRVIPIHSVRVKDTLTTHRIGKPGFEREVATAGNHHVAIVAHLDEAGNEIRWEGRVVSLLEATARLNARRAARRVGAAGAAGSTGQPLPSVVDYGSAPRTRPKFTLRPGDSVRLTGAKENAREEIAGEELFVVRSISEGDIEFASHVDARSTGERRRDPIRVRSIDGLRKLACRKVEITVLGEDRPAND